MHYHMILTDRCNSQCKYCYEKSLKEFDNGLNKKFEFDFSAPSSSEVSIAKLKKFIGKDKDPVLIFYGGEPLLEIDKIKEIMDNFQMKFRLQTNGKLLNKLPLDYLKKIGKILISLDGDKERTDFNKGKGTYDLVMANIEKLREEGYRGELIARMTISEFPDIYEQVRYLVEQEGFNSIHWQLDAGFYKFDFDKDKFSKFVEEYNASITKLADYWVQDMKLNRRVLRLYPFIGIIESLLTGEKTKLRCGAGENGYTIGTDGKIYACPIMNCIKDFEAGTLDDNPSKLLKFEVSGKCLKCVDKDLCGGRCLYWNMAKLWPAEGDDLICSTVKHLIKEMKRILPEIEHLIKKEKIKREYFDYEKYFGPEIIP